jgi:allantoicase
MTDFTNLVDLASERLGGAAIAANDEFFAPKDNLVKDAAPVWIEDRYTDRGKWMDGWETRRRREPGHDWCIVRLGLPGIVRGVIVDTAFFRGNYPEACSIDASLPETVDPTAVPGVDEWTELLPRSLLQGDSQTRFAIASPRRCTHLRLNIHPDGGVARLRVFGEPVPDWDRILRHGGALDLAAIEHGGLVINASDMFFGSRHNLIMPGRPAGMHDGWETRRRRGPGHDWAVVRLGRRGRVVQIDVDTTHYKGNAPGRCSIDVCDVAHDAPAGVLGPWRELLGPTTLLPHTVHRFDQGLADAGAATHVRLNIYPDGGVARLRVYGLPE